MISGFIKSGKTQTIYLITPVPVHLTYFTCWVDNDGKLHFRPDIYKRDV